jgi:Flp pilus assembly pilin Flp
MVLRPWRLLRRAIAHLQYREQAQAISEYTLLIAALAVLLIVGMLFLTSKIDDLFSDTGSPSPGILRPPTASVCNPNYAGACVPLDPPDLDCTDLRALGVPLPVRVVGSDPLGLDPDGDGFGC